MTVGQGWVTRLKRAAESGVLLDLAPGIPNDQVRPDNSAEWPAERVIPAADLRAVLIDPELRVDPHGLQIRAARFTEHLDLENVDFPHTLRLTSCCLAAGMNADWAVFGYMDMNHTHAEGAVRAVGIRITGQLQLAGANLANLDGDALNLDGAAINGGVVASGLHAEGAVRAVGIRITGQLQLTGANLADPGGNALNLQSAEVDELWLRPDVFAGTLELTAAKITLLHTTAEPPRPLVAAGWEVGDVHGPLRHDWDLARRWLESGRLVAQPLGVLLVWSPKQLRAWKRQNADLLTESGADLLIRRWWFRPWQHRVNLVEAIVREGGGTAVAVQPWTVLAAVYDRAGDPDSAKRLRVAAEQQVTRQSFGWPTWRTWFTRKLYSWTAGYGYHPLRAFWWMLAVLGLAVALVAVNREDIVPTDPAKAHAAVERHFGIRPETTGAERAEKQAQADQLLPLTAQTPCAVHPDYPCMNSLNFAISAVLPPAASTNRDWDIAADATLALTAVLPTLKLISWALAAVLLAGVTGLLRKD
jgi:hypothetical protein